MINFVMLLQLTYWRTMVGVSKNFVIYHASIDTVVPSRPHPFPGIIIAFYILIPISRLTNPQGRWQNSYS